MKLFELLNEGIRMGSKELAIPAKKEYTIGFEFELSVTGGTSYEDDVDQEEFDREDNFEEMYEQFHSYWYSGGSTFNFKDWFNDTINRDFSVREIALENAYDPRFGYPDEDETDIIVAHLERESEQMFKERSLPSDKIDTAMSFLNVFDDIHHELDDDILSEFAQKNKKLIDDFFVFFLKYVREYSPDEMNNHLEMVRGVPVDSSAYLYTLRQSIYETKRRTRPDPVDPEEVEREFEDYEYIYADEKQERLINTNDDIMNLDDFLSYFDTDVDEMKSELSDRFADDEQHAFQSEFERWMNDPAGFNGVSKMAQVASILRNNFGPTKWNIVPDETAGVDAEVVTSVMGIEEGLSFLEKMLNIIRKEPILSTNTATGLHVNIGTWDHSEVDTVDWLKFLMVFHPNFALEQFERISNTFTEDRTAAIMAGFEGQDLNPLHASLPEINKIVKLASTKYSAVNLSKLTQGYIEVRAMGNAGYEEKQKMIVNQIQRIIRALEIASDPSLYKREYIKKLYSVMNPSASNHDEMDKAIKQYFAKGRVAFAASDPIMSIYALILNGVPPTGITARAITELITLLKNQTKIYPNLNIGNKMIDMISSLQTDENTRDAIQKSTIINRILKYFPPDPNFTPNDTFTKDWF